MLDIEIRKRIVKILELALEKKWEYKNLGRLCRACGFFDS